MVTGGSTKRHYLHEIAQQQQVLYNVDTQLRKQG